MKGLSVISIFGILVILNGVRCQRWFNVTDDFKNIPNVNGSKADVSVQLELTQLIANSPMMNVQINYFMILRWFDYRFVKQGSTDPNKRWVTVFGNDADWEKIWIPDVYLINEIPQGLLDAAPTDSIRIYENGTVKMTKRHSITIFCKIRLFKLPMTREICSIEFQSNSYTKEQMNLAWWEYDAVTYSSNFVSVVSKITDVETTFCNGQTTEEQQPCLYANVGIDQVYKGFMIQVYLPSSAIIIMLWLGFWISLREVSSRVRVVSMAFVTIVTQMVGIMIVFPDTVQMEPLLVWNGVCLLMNLLAFVEYIVVHNMYISRVIKNKQNQELIISSPITDSSTSVIPNGHAKVSNQNYFNDSYQDSMIPNGGSNNKSHGTFKNNKVAPVRDPEKMPLFSKKATYSKWCTPYRVDRICMVLFLILFAIFNVVYWVHYLSLLY